MNRLIPLTSIEIDRMRDIYASGPLETGERHALTDASLALKGWIEPYDDDKESPAVVPSRAAYGLPKGKCSRAARCVLYADNGCVADCWRRPS